MNHLEAQTTVNAAKKGWSAAARLKSALVRKAKKKAPSLKSISPNSPEYKKLKAGDKEKVLQNALKQFDKQGSVYRSVKTKGFKNLLDVRVEANKSIGRFEGMARAYRKRAEGLKGKKRRIYLHMALNCLQQASQLSSDVMKRKRPVTNNTVKALLIINARKGWSDVARKKAALARKKKAGVKSGESKPTKKSGGASPKRGDTVTIKFNGKNQKVKVLKRYGTTGSVAIKAPDGSRRLIAPDGYKMKSSVKKVGTKSGESKPVKKVGTKAAITKKGRSLADRAWKLEDKAGDSGSFYDHQNAAKAHEAAVKFFKKVGDKKKAAYHDRRAKKYRGDGGMYRGTSDGMGGTY